ncbi:MAG: DUF502 domain-containing protein [Opitutales bacterium]
MIKSLRNSLITGLVILLPLSVTLFILYFLVTKIGSPISNVLFKPLLDEIDQTFINEYVLNIILDTIGTLLVILAITLIGFLSKFILGKFAINTFEALIDKIPVAKQIYNTVKQIVDTFSKQKKAVFQEVVLIEFPRKGAYAIGFLTSEAKGEIQHKTGEEVVNIFVPTTPNPTSGFLVMFAKNEVTSLDMTVAEAMKLIISGGAVSPQWAKKID